MTTVSVNVDREGKVYECRVSGEPGFYNVLISHAGRYVFLVQGTCDPIGEKTHAWSYGKGWSNAGRNYPINRVRQHRAWLEAALLAKAGIERARVVWGIQ